MGDSSGGEELETNPLMKRGSAAAGTKKNGAGTGEKVRVVDPSSEYLLVNKDDYLSMASSMEVLLKLVADARKEPVHLLDDDTNREDEAWAVKSQEPRTHLANERTFLNWITINVNLFLIGVALQATVPGWLGRSSSMLFGVVSILGIIYATTVFNRRVHGNFFNDRFGPMVLALVMLFAMVLGLIFVLTNDLVIESARTEQTLSASARQVEP